MWSVFRECLAPLEYPRIGKERKYCRMSKGQKQRRQNLNRDTAIDCCPTLMVRSGSLTGGSFQNFCTQCPWGGCRSLYFYVLNPYNFFCHWVSQIIGRGVAALNKIKVNDRRAPFLKTHQRQHSLTLEHSHSQLVLVVKSWWHRSLSDLKATGTDHHRECNSAFPTIQIFPVIQQDKVVYI